VRYSSLVPAIPELFRALHRLVLHTEHGGFTMKRPTMLMALLLVLLSACGGGSGGTTSTSQVGNAMSSTAASAAASAAVGASGGSGASASFSAAEDLAQGASGEAAVPVAAEQVAPAQQAESNRLVIRTATQSMVVERVDVAEGSIRQIAAERGGYVLNSQSSGEAAARSATITIKVPAERFDETLATLGNLAQQIESQQIVGQDVTDEFVDLESRLRNLRALEARLLQFLEEARNVEDSLRVSQELSRTQGEIEQVQGRITYLRQSAALATITVSLRSVVVPSLTATNVEWSPLRTARGALSGVIAFGQALITLGIVVAVWAPVWGPLLVLGMWFWRRGRRVPTTTT